MSLFVGVKLKCGSVLLIYFCKNFEFFLFFMWRCSIISFERSLKKYNYVF